MGYTLNKKNINLDKKFRLNTDSLSDVYMLNRGIAVRVFKENIDRSLVLSEYECEFISKLRCDNMLMPKQLLYKNNKYEGYSFRNINKVRKDKIISANKKDLVADLEMIEEDLDVLSNAYVMLDGITPRNVVYSDGLYITDVSQFKVLNKKCGFICACKSSNSPLRSCFCSLVTCSSMGRVIHKGPTMETTKMATTIKPKIPMDILMVFK